MISKLKIWHSDKRADLVLGKNVIDVKALIFAVDNVSDKTVYTFKIIPYELCSLFLNSLFLF